tara:strand:+ start:2617 stop:3696 length:1080 start_codon:yes stop_codon:yes gene_type:complete
MFKVYQTYLIQKFLIKFLYISLIFFSLSIILGLLEEISFFKDLNKNLLYPYFLTFLNAPITLFEIFPFIFLLTTQFLFYDLFRNSELDLLKQNGLNNLKIVKILFFLSILIGIFNISIYYNIASTLKFKYSDIKNSFSNDNKYLAMVTDSGIWIKDEINSKTLIIKSNYFKDNFLYDSIINEFDNNFELLRTIQSEKINIEDNTWIIYDSKITVENISKEYNENLVIQTNFNKDKINNLFSDILTLNLIKLFDQKKDFEKLGYSSDEINIHLLRLFTTPFFYGMLTILSAIIMFNFSKDKSIIFNVIIGILMSVIIYYIVFIFSSLGTNGKLPVYISIFFPLILISIVSIIGLINLNEK